MLSPLHIPQFFSITSVLMFGRTTSGFGGFSSTSNSGSPFGGGTAVAPNPGFSGPAASAFGSSNNSVFGQNTSTGNAFGSTTGGGAFGQTNSGATSAFGQPANSGFGQSNNSIFGLNANQSNTTSTFGAPANNTANSGSGIFGGTSKPFGSAFDTPQNNSITPFGGAGAGSSAFGGVDPNVNNGTAVKPFSEVVEKDSSGTNKFQNISIMPEYKNFLFEELRMKDYEQNRRYGTGTTATPGGFGATGNNTSIFGNNGTSVFGHNNNSSFGNTSANAFGQNNNSTSGFGGSNVYGSLNNTNMGTSSFGSNANNATSGGFGGAFGGSSSSAFGTSKPAGFGSTLGNTGGFGSLSNNNTTNSTLSAFGGGLNNTNSSPFGQGSNNTGTFGVSSNSPFAANSSGGGLFGGNNNAGLAFGTSNTGSAFGGTSAFGANTNTGNSGNIGTNASGGLFPNSGSGFGAKPATGGLFGANNGQQSAFGQNNTGGFFGQNNNNNNQSGTVFGRNNSHQSEGMFGQNNAAGTNSGSFFGNNSNTSGAPGGLFGSNNNNNTSGGLFGTKPAASSGNMFGGASNAASGGFGAQTSNTSGGLFGKPSAPATAGGLLGNAANTSDANASSGGFLGGNNITAPRSSLFGGLSSTAPNNLAGGLFGSKQPAPNTSSGGLFSTNQNSSTNTSNSMFGGNNSFGQQQQLQLQPSQQHHQVGQQEISMGGPMPKLLTHDPYGSSQLFQSITGSVSNHTYPQVTVLNSKSAQKRKRYNLASVHRLEPLFRPKKAAASTESSIVDIVAQDSSNGGVLSAIDNAILSSDIFTPKTDYKKLVLSNTKESLQKLIPNKAPEIRSVAFVVDKSDLKEDSQIEASASEDVDDDGYWMSPSMTQLKKKSPAELRKVSDFTVGRKYYGQVRFTKPVDLTAINWDDICGNLVVFGSKNMVIYPDDDQPKAGEGLNMPAEVTLEGCYPTNKRTKLAVLDPKDEVVKQHIQQLKSLPDIQFLKYDPPTGNWTFAFEHV